MCRLAAYSGPELLLKQLILAPVHSLYKQSWEPKELREVKLNADGFGVGWYDKDSQPARYRNTQAIWADVNLEDLSSVLKQPLWLANVRSATPGQGTGLDNTQPFVCENILYMHNGYISNFEAIKTEIIASLDANIIAGVKGNTDSEYLFALIRQELVNEPSLPLAIQSLCKRLEDLLKQSSALINIIISNGTDIHALKFSVNAEAPSLYYLENSLSFPDAVVIASEPFTPEENWLAVEEKQILSIDRQRRLSFTIL